MNERRTLAIGTRGSALALAQARWVGEWLEARGRATRVEVIRTRGDVPPDEPLPAEGVGLFTSALQEALGSGRVDLVVHSLKDLPLLPSPGLTLAAVPVRADPRDAWVGRPPGRLVRVGTSSPRRRALLGALYPEVTPVPLRGNLDTRLGRVQSGAVDAVVVAQAGLSRLGHKSAALMLLDPDRFVPAPAQGALGVEVRTEDDDARLAVADLDDETTRRCALAERSVLAGLGGGCQLPMGAHARAAGEGYVLTAFHAPAGLTPRWARREGRDPAELAALVTAALGGR